eukprot:CAMPEP_0177763358 /NCGR_PEP_ID=MMETSP0491_2-20121128/6827_1 /TAXON_ID=63592 /ORGANISM="Tetraselmis chuii, Strain PLY429" /LENGTH=333 /DNA_ID=CAMNT_0019279457 /DNA_START=274 /DNA_END=1275 /DNA_ORIENTATION=-
MALFDTELFAQKLEQLAPTQQGIEGLSKWCLFFKSELKKVVATWDVQFQKAGPEKRLSFLYLANDMLQNGRKKAPELAAEFYRVLPRALKTMHKAGIAKDIARVKRLVHVWGERRVYSPNTIKQLQSLIPQEAAAPSSSAPPAKRAKTVDAPAAREAVMDKRLQPMATAFAKVSKAEVQSNKLLLALSPVCRKGLENDGSISELVKAQLPLKDYTGALENEVAGREAAIIALKEAVAIQEKGIKDAQSKLQLSKQHLQKVSTRLETMRKQHVQQFKAKQASSQPLVSAGPGGASAEAATNAGNGSSSVPAAPSNAAMGNVDPGAEDEYDPENP